MENRIIAVRSGGSLAGAVWFFISAGVFGLLTIVGFINDAIVGVIFLIGAIIFLCIGFYYVHTHMAIPEVIAEVKNGVICFYPSKKECIEAAPKDIGFVSQKRYGRFGNSLSGELEIKIFPLKTVLLRYVANVEEARCEIEKLRNSAKNAD